MISFKNDQFLGKAVKNTKMFCSIGIEPIVSIDQIRFAAGGNMFSQLCGFMFDSVNGENKYPRFSISFVSKLRSKAYKRNGNNGGISAFNTSDSQWYMFKRINSLRVDVLDKKAMLVNYGFDVVKFFDSDLFKAAVPKFIATLNKGLAECNKFIESGKLDASQKLEARRYVNAIQSAMQFIKDTDFNDKYYQLNNLDALAKAVDAAKSPDQKQNELDAKFDNIRKFNAKKMSDLRSYSDKKAKNDYIYQKLHGRNESLEEADRQEDLKEDFIEYGSKIPHEKLVADAKNLNYQIGYQLVKEIVLDKYRSYGSLKPNALTNDTDLKNAIAHDIKYRLNDRKTNIEHELKVALNTYYGKNGRNKDNPYKPYELIVIGYQSQLDGFNDAVSDLKADIDANGKLWNDIVAKRQHNEDEKVLDGKIEEALQEIYR